MSNVNVDRLVKRTAALQTFTVPPRPKLPDRFMRKFPELKEYQAQDESWWRNFQTLLREQLIAIRDES